MTARPALFASSSTPRARSVKNGVATAGHTSAPGGRVAHEAEPRDRGVHPVARRPGHDVGPVEHVGDRGDGDAGVGGDLPDADRHVYPLLDWTDRQSEARYWNVSNP